MIHTLKQSLCPVRFMTGVMVLFFFFLIGSCASKLPVPEKLFPGYTGPQIAVTPKAIRLGIAGLVKTQVVIAGSGFQPGDSVFVDMVSTEGNQNINIPIDAAKIDPNGQFTVEVSKEVKALEILKLDIDPSDLTPIVVRDPIPIGKYLLKAVSVDSDRKAECPINVEAPSWGDKLKDKIGVWFGKIRMGR
jgi:hypothetical protein